jgi:thiamine biosynthesis lipoprotein
VSEELFFVLSRAQEVSRRSGGAFDVTVGPVVRLWRRARRTHRLPDPEKLAHARALVGYKNIRLNDKARAVQLLKPGMQLGLGGIAKGYAADQALAVLAKHGLTWTRTFPTRSRRWTTSSRPWLLKFTPEKGG